MRKILSEVRIFSVDHFKLYVLAQNAKAEINVIFLFYLEINNKISGRRTKKNIYSVGRIMPKE